MGAKGKLNEANVLACVLIAGLVGGLTQSWLLFVLVFVCCWPPRSTAAAFVRDPSEGSVRALLGEAAHGRDILYKRKGRARPVPPLFLPITRRPFAGNRFFSF